MKRFKNLDLLGNQLIIKDYRWEIKQDGTRKLLIKGIGGLPVRNVHLFTTFFEQESFEENKERWYVVKNEFTNPIRVSIDDNYKPNYLNKLLIVDVKEKKEVVKIKYVPKERNLKDERL